MLLIIIIGIISAIFETSHCYFTTVMNKWAEMQIMQIDNIREDSYIFLKFINIFIHFNWNPEEIIVI